MKERKKERAKRKKINKERKKERKKKNYIIQKVKRQKSGLKK